MPYASERIYLDADSHIMERPNFLRDYATAAVKDKLPPLTFGDTQDKNSNWAQTVAAPGHSESEVAAMVALGDDLIAGPKGYKALGAFNPGERSQALDQLGFGEQLVFATFSAYQGLHGDDVELKYGAAAAHNRAMADFCSADERLLGVGILPLDDPQRASAELEQLLKAGLNAAWVAHEACGGRSPGHNDFDPIWARLAEARVPFVLHVGGQPLQLAPRWMNTGRPLPTDWMGGGENVRAKDMLALHHNAELFLGSMIFDGALERHPTLRGGAIELGAGWVPSWLERLDWTAAIWKKETDIGTLTRTPTEIAVEQLAFTPYVYEDVGALIAISDPRLYLFSSDYPHFKGSRNPIERFERSLDQHNVDQAAKQLFYEDNFRRLVHYN